MSGRPARTALGQLAALGAFDLPRLAPALGLGGAAVALHMATQTAIPLVIGAIVDQALLARDPRALLLRVLLLVGAAVVGSGAKAVHQVSFAALGERSRAELQAHLLGRLYALPIAFFDRERSGRVQSLLSEDAAAAARSTFEMLSEALLGAVHLGLLLAVIAGRYGWAVLAALALIPVYVVCPLLLSRPTRRAAGAALAATAEVTACLQESIQGVREVRLFGREGWAVARLRQWLSADVAHQLRLALVRSVYGLEYVIYITAASAVYWWGGQAVLRGRLTVGALVALVALLTTLDAPVRRLMGLAGDYQRLRAAVERMTETVGAAALPPAAGAAELLPGPHRLRFEGVGFRYDAAGPPVLSDLSFAVEPGERVALVGPSGAGKSTLVGLLARLYEPEQGRITIDGRDLRAYSLASLRRAIGFVLQDTMLFSGTVEQNLRFGDPAATAAELERSARAANAHDFIARLAHGYATQIGERGVQLSGGQRQRLGIARVLLRRPSLLVLDEAMSALDGPAERLVRQGLERLMADRTTLIVAHRPAAFTGADRILVLAGGRLVGQGTHRELLASCAVYRGLAGEPEAPPAAPDLDRSVTPWEGNRCQHQPEPEPAVSSSPLPGPPLPPVS